MLRAFANLGLGAAVGLFSYAIGVGLTGSPPGGIGIAVVATLIGTTWLLPKLRIEESACPTWLKVLSGMATVLAILLVGRLSVFMLDASRPGASLVPSSTWEVQHSCLSAYYVAADAIRTKPNVYDNALYTAPDDDPAKPRKALMLGPFKIDVFEYPPPFLLLPRALLAVTPDFLDMRRLWFGLNGLVMLAAFVVLAHALGPAAGTRALLLSPLIWLAPGTLSTLQKGNVQVVVVAISMLAMLLFARGRPVAGSALLAFAIASKLYPGLLVVYLIVRREWKAVAWTVAFGIGYGALTLAAFGWAPWQAFLTHFPGLMSGEAFPAFRNPMAMANNLSIPGLVFKAKLWGAPGMGFPASKAVGWLYTIAALAAVVWAGRRSVVAEREPLVWLAILILATLRSPFLPAAYGAVPAIWLVTLIAAAWRAPGWSIALGAPLFFYWPNDWPAEPKVIAAIALLPIATMIAVSALALRGPRPGALKGP